MIDLYTWTTPNGRKVSIALEELGLPYTVHPIDISKGEQFAPDFLKIAPNNRIPAIVDPEGPGGRLPLFESGAILLYLSARTGNRFLPATDRGKWIALQWLMFQMGGVGPMFGQANYFYRLEEKVPYAIERYHKESLRLYGVLEQRLGESEYLAGEYSIADIATYTWVGRHEMHHVKLEEFPKVKRWFDVISQRPAVQRGMEIPKR